MPKGCRHAAEIFWGEAMTRVALAFALVLGVFTAPASGQDESQRPNSWFRVSFAAAEHSVAPRITGHVYNDSPYRVTDVQLEVEGLGADSRPVGRRFVWAFGDIVPGGETSFAAEAMPEAVSYRITVSSFDVISIGVSP